MKVLFINHKKSHCGVYEIGLRIFNLFNKEILSAVYEEVENLEEYHKCISIHKPDAILYNYYSETMLWLNPLVTKMQPNIKHIGIIHDQLKYPYMSVFEAIFEAWIIHDETNPLPNVKKFMTIRPIPRYNRTESIDLENISIGTNGFVASSWKMYDTIVEYINASFTNATINMNLGLATYGPKMNEVLSVAKKCKTKVTKPGIILNITHDYFPTEMDLISWLAKNTLNIYFYNTPYPGIGVGGSPDLAIAAQSSLAVNDTYMLRHISQRLGSCTQNDISKYLDNSDKVKQLYDDWNPDRMTLDYKNMIEKILNTPSWKKY